MANYESIVEACKKSGGLFEDPDLPAVDESIFFSRQPPRPFEWKRPKDIVKDPKLFADGCSRFDINQGMLGDCWLLAAIASLTQYENLLYRVVPPDQSFDTNYHGAIKFMLWLDGEWTEVVIDDRLPTFNGKLVFMHSNVTDEFWSAMLEKALAKIAGSYEALKGGRMSEALLNFTGGVVERIKLGSETPDDLMRAMMKAQARQSLMGCYIQDDRSIEGKGPNGLVSGHCYTITSVTKVHARARAGSTDVELVRVRNPWGNEREWTGAWSDGSNEWSMVSEEDKRNLELNYSGDGEFWMAFPDFIKAFTDMDMCHLSPDSCVEAMAARDTRSRSWSKFQDIKEWVHGVSAGGCRNYINTFANNPQFRINLIDTDDDADDVCSFVVSLMQLGRRALKRKGAQNLTIGYAIYEVPDGSKPGPLTKEFFMYNKSVIRSSRFINEGECCERHTLPPGTYAVIPSTFKPNEPGKFLLRIFSEKPHNTELLDEKSAFNKETAEHHEPSENEKAVSDSFFKMFKQLGGADELIDAFELKAIVEKLLKGQTGPTCVEVDGCRALVARYSSNGFERLGFNDFISVWKDISKWLKTFKAYDRDDNDTMDAMELRNAMSKLGFRLSNVVLTRVTQRFCSRKGVVNIFDFFVCINRLTACFETYPKIKNSPLALDDFIMAMLKC